MARILGSGKLVFSFRFPSIFFSRHLDSSEWTISDTVNGLQDEILIHNSIKMLPKLGSCLIKAFCLCQLLIIFLLIWWLFGICCSFLDFVDLLMLFDDNDYECNYDKNIRWQLWLLAFSPVAPPVVPQLGPSLRGLTWVWARWHWPLLSIILLARWQSGVIIISSENWRLFRMTWPEECASFSSPEATRKSWAASKGFHSTINLLLLYQ